MGIAVSIVSAVLKSVVGDKLGSGIGKDLIGISIDGISEKGINEITDFMNGEKSKIDSILSEEKNNYVVTEVKELLSKIDITDEVLGQCKYDSMNLSVFLWDKYRECKNDYIECESEIKRCLFGVAEALIKLVRVSENFKKDVLIHISNSVDDANVELQKISDYMKENFGKLDDNSQIVISVLLTILGQIQKMNMQDNETKSTTDEAKKFQNDKKQKYIENWNSRLFLHVDDEDNPVTLADAFIMPDFEMHKSVKRIGSYSDSFEELMDEFIKYDRTSTMLIRGVPGIGKSTITSWIANKYKDDKSILILRFRDWNKDELEKGFLNAICKKLDCKNEDLENKVLGLDGFDEMKTLNIREKLLNEFISDIKDFENFKCIITSRTNYISSKNFDIALELSPFNYRQIRIFYKKITKRKLNGSIDENNIDVFGIPVILYMAIMSYIDITKNITKPKLYNRIFAEENGIFDRFSHEGIAYSEGAHIFRNSENIDKYLSFLQEVAFAMYEKNNLSLSIKEYKIPELEFQGKFISVLEFPIKHLFENAEVSIEFIHKSIYEYFVSEYIFSSLLAAIDSSTDELAKTLGYLFKYNSITNEILEFLGFKIINSKLNKEFNAMYKAFQLMLQDGMLYYTKENYKNAFRREMDVFSNMLEILHLWEDDYLEFDNTITGYLRYNRNSHLNLKGVILRAEEKDNDGVLNLTKGLYLKDVYLEGADLEGTGLEGADLEGANLKGANLKGANLEKANLEKANLTGANLERANLTGANLEGANLYGAHLEGANLKNANLRGMDLKRANLKEADLRKADLTGAQLQFAQLESANLSKAMLKNVSLIGTDLIDANLIDTDLTDAMLDGSQWYASDVKKIFPQLKLGKFSYIIVADCQKKKLYKNELFLNINSSGDSDSSFLEIVNWDKI